MNTSPASPAHILIVEDEKSLRDVYTIILERAGYDVCTAANGLEGLDKVATCNPDFVLLDIFMPVMGGIEFMKQVNLHAHPDMRVVVFSNNSDSSVKDEVFELGAHAAVVKSEMAPNNLIELVREQLAVRAEH